MANKHQAQQSGVRVLKGNSSESSQEDPDRDFDAHWSQGCIDPDELFSKGVSGTKTAPSGSRSPIPCSEVGISQRARPAAELAQPEAAQPEPICAEERAPDPAQDAKLHSHCRLSTIIIGPTDPWASPSGARQGGQCQLPPQMIMPMSAMDHADDVVGDSVLDGILDVLAAPAQPASTEGEEDAIATGEAESPAHECEEAEGKKSKGREFQEVDGKESVGQGFKEAEGKESEGGKPPAALGDAKTLAAEDSEASNSEVNEGTDEEGRVAAEDTVSASLLHQEDSPGLVDDDSCEALEGPTNALQIPARKRRRIIRSASPTNHSPTSPPSPSYASFDFDEELKTSATPANAPQQESGCQVVERDMHWGPCRSNSSKSQKGSDESSSGEESTSSKSSSTNSSSSGDSSNGTRSKQRPRADKIPVVGPMSWLPSLPERVDGVEWWLERLWNAMVDKRARLPKEPAAVYTTEHLCAGAGTDLMAFKILNVPHRCLGVAEKKPGARAWLKQEFGALLGRLYTANSAFIDGHGTDVLGGKRKSNKGVKISTIKPRCVTAGLPCQPWTRARSKSGTSERGSCPSQHPDYQTTMIEFPAYLHARQPDQFFIEEVPDMAKFFTNMSGSQVVSKANEYDEDCEDPKSDLWEFMRRCCAAGYAVRSWEADHGLFVEVPRTRTAQ